jgi:hypothetical protein
VENLLLGSPRLRSVPFNSVGRATSSIKLVIDAYLNHGVKGLNNSLIHVKSRRELNVPHITLEVISRCHPLQEDEDHRDQIHDQTSHSRWFRGDHFAHLLGTFVVLFNICPSYRFIV